MFANACTTTQVFSVESTFSALMSGDVEMLETIYNFYKNNLVHKIKSGLTAFNQLRDQVEQNTITRLRTTIFQNENTKVCHGSKVNIQYFSLH